jgi:ligand-binding sensor domain-containing protein
MFWIMVVSHFFISRSCALVDSWTTLTNTNFIQDICCENDTVWLATTGGVVSFDIQTKRIIHTLTNVDGLSHVIVNSLILDKQDIVWFGTDGGGVSKYRRTDGKWRTYSIFDGVALHVRTLLQDGNNLWIGTDEGISFFQWGWDWSEHDTTFVWKENYDSRNGIPNNLIISLAADDSTIWVGTENGLCRAQKKANLKDPLSWTTYSVNSGLPGTKVLSIVLYQAGLWVGTDKGVAFFNGMNWEKKGLPDHSIHSLRVFHDTVWAATSKGIYALHGDEWENAHNESLQSLDIRVLNQISGETIICGTWGKGLAVFDGSTWTHFDSVGPWRNNFEKVMVDKTGSVWCSTIESPDIARLSKYQNGQWINYDEDEGIKSNMHILGMREDDDGRKWFGTWGAGVYRLDDKGTVDKSDDVWKEFNSQNSGIHGTPEDPTYEVITDIIEDEEGNIWFANFGIGVVVYSPVDSLWETYTVSDGLVDRLTRALALETDGIIWIGAEQNGASRLQTDGTPFQKADDDWDTFNASNGLTNRTIYSIVHDKQDAVWLASSEGLFRYKDNQLNSINYVQNTSILSLEIDPIGDIWVGTSDRGVFVFDHQGHLRLTFNVENSGLVSNEIQSISFNQNTEIGRASCRERVLRNV